MAATAALKKGTDLFSGAGVAGAYARHLLDDLDLAHARAIEPSDEHPALSWASSGLMQLTGRADGPPQRCPVPLAACADGVLAALASLALADAFAGLRGSQLLGERAAITGATRNGSISPGGSCRLLECADGWIALNLAREDDVSLVPAWLERDVEPQWDAIIIAVRERGARELVERGRELGLAVALDEVPPAPDSWFSASSPRKRGSMDDRLRGHDEVRVVDLSSLWAGPLCGHLLQRMGADVIKVESTARPDGARAGPPAFFDLLNGGKASVALDFASRRGREQLRALISGADIVIEASRPRALRQLGIDAEEFVAANPGLTWLSITAHGRDPARENWIGYGDDAGVAAGLSRLMFEATGEHLIVGDAIGDPLTGLHAALAAWGTHLTGGGLVSLSLSGVVGHLINWGQTTHTSRFGDRPRYEGNGGLTPISLTPISRPRARLPQGIARPLGADTVVYS